MTALIVRADARALPLPDACVDLIVTSPPYWALRKYGDGEGEHSGQIGAEPAWGEYLENLWDATAEWARVLKLSGSMFVNMGDKYANTGSGPTGKTSGVGVARGRRNQHDITRIKQGCDNGNIPPKCLLGLPWRYALGCVDHLGLILRRDNIWHKTNPLPESVVDRCPTTHEYVFHLTRGSRYFSAADEIREPHADGSAHAAGRRARTDRRLDLAGGGQTTAANPLGKIPGSVWPSPSEPLRVPAELGVDHFAAFPTALPRRCILGWTPHGICVECGEGRRPVADVSRRPRRPNPHNTYGAGKHGTGDHTLDTTPAVRIAGYSCACTPHTDHHPGGVEGAVRGQRRGARVPGGGSGTPHADNNGGLGNNPRVGPWREYHLDRWRPAPTRPAVVLDPMGGAGTVALVADVLGRIGISADPVHGYGRIARWRTADPRQRARAAGGPARAKPGVQLPLPGQAELFEGAAG